MPSRRRAAEKRFGLKRFRIVVGGMKGAAELVEVFVAEIIMTDDGCTEKNEQEKKEQGSERLVAVRLGRLHDNYLFFNELMREILYCSDPDLSI